MKKISKISFFYLLFFAVYLAINMVFEFVEITPFDSLICSVFNLLLILFLIIYFILVNKKKRCINIFFCDLEPDRFMEQVKKLDLLFSDFEKDYYTAIYYRVIEQNHKALEVVKKMDTYINKENKYMYYFLASDYCKCYIALNNKELAQYYLNLAMGLVGSIKSDKKRNSCQFNADLLERTFYINFDETYSDYFYFEGLLNSGYSYYRRGLYNTLNIILFRYNLALIYKRVENIQLANANFQYVVNNGKNLPIVIRARKQLGNLMV